MQPCPIRSDPCEKAPKIIHVYASKCSPSTEYMDYGMLRNKFVLACTMYLLVLKIFSDRFQI